MLRAVTMTGRSGWTLRWCNEVVRAGRRYPKRAQGYIQDCHRCHWGLGGKGSKGFRQEEASEVERAEGEHSRAAVGGVLVLVLRAQTVQRARPRPRAPRGPHP